MIWCFVVVCCGVGCCVWVFCHLYLLGVGCGVSGVGCVPGFLGAACCSPLGVIVLMCAVFGFSSFRRGVCALVCAQFYFSFPWKGNIWNCLILHPTGGRKFGMFPCFLTYCVEKFPWALKNLKNLKPFVILVKPGEIGFIPEIPGFEIGFIPTQNLNLPVLFFKKTFCVIPSSCFFSRRSPRTDVYGIWYVLFSI